MLAIHKIKLHCLAAVGLWFASQMMVWPQTFSFSTVAGNSGYGSVDGPTNNARFDFPEGVAADPAGNIYVADTQNSTIRRIDPNGLVTTLAGVAGGTGNTDGTGSGAKFMHPQGVAVDVAGNIYVADTANSTIRKITTAGAVSTLVGSPGVTGKLNGTNSAALFKLPGALAVYAGTNIFVADTYNSTIRLLAPLDASGTNWVVTTLAGSPNINANLDGTNTTARFYQPSGIAVDGNRVLYVADAGNNAIRKITPSGTNWVTTTIAQLTSPGNISVDGAGNLYVTGSADNTVSKLAPSGANWVVSPVAGNSGIAGSADGNGTNATFNYPRGIAAAANAVLYVADSLNNTIRRVTVAGVVATVAGQAGGSGSTDGFQNQARFNAPLGLAVDAGTNIYVADSQNNTIRRITPAGVVTTLAGVATNLPGSVNGNGTNASFNLPASVAVDSQTNVYVADLNNNEIRKLTPMGSDWVVTTLAGRAGQTYYGMITNIVGGNTNVSPAFSSTSLFQNYSGVITNISGNLTNTLIVITNLPFVTNAFNGAIQTNWLDTNVFTLAPAPPLLDGTGPNALFHHPSGLALDNTGILYVADGGTNGVRLVAPGGVVTTLAGSAGAYTVDPLRFGTNTLYYHSSAVAVDGAGNVFVSDAVNQTIRQIAGGTAATLAGSPGLYGVADGTNAGARFASPVSLALDAQTNLLVTDSSSHTIRRISPSGANWVVTTVGGQPNISGSMDGVAGAASFNSPGGVAVDGRGNLYVADTGNNTIRLGLAVMENIALQITSAANQLIISWPAPAAGFRLETSSNLVNWTSVTNVTGSGFTVSNYLSSPAAFYRLSNP